MPEAQWEPLTVFDNVDAAVRHIGLDNIGVVWGLANIDWTTVAERDAFLQAISRRGIGQ